MKKPDNLIPKTKLVQIMTDLGKAESIVRLKINQIDSLNDSLKVYPDSIYSSVLEKYHITKSQLNSSLKWYLKTPKKLEDIFNQSITQLTKEASQLSAGMKENKKDGSHKADSNK